MTEVSTQAAAHALYMEFMLGTTDCYQMIVIPAGRDTAGNGCRPTVFRRQLTSATTRKSWRTYSTTHCGHLDTTVSEGIVCAEAAQAHVDLTDRVMQQLINRGWKLYKEPIVVEMTAEDYRDVTLMKMPYKLLGRVNKAKKFLGFTEFWKGK